MNTDMAGARDGTPDDGAPPATTTTDATATRYTAAVPEEEEEGDGTVADEPPVRVRVSGHRPAVVGEQPRPAQEGLCAADDESVYPERTEAVHGGRRGGKAGDADLSLPHTSPREVDQGQPSPLPPPSTTAAAAWTLDFSGPARKTRRKTTRKEREAMSDCHWRRTATETRGGVGGGDAGNQGLVQGPPSAAVVADSEGNVTLLGNTSTADKVGVNGLLPVVSLDGYVDRAMLVPTNLTTSTREKLQERLCLRLPRLLCVNKQYPRSCGVSSLTSIYNYLYSWLGETPAYKDQAPVSQEELMTILGFEPPFGEIPWGSFTGNATLIRWFYALNRHFQRPRGRAYILYKAHGHGKTTHLFDHDNAAILAEVKRCLANPRCALIYHCYNHYMCPIGYQDTPVAQTDFLKPDVAPADCDTTLFIGEVSRGRHEAMYARRWSEIVKDIECKSPYFFNIRHPEQGIQSRAKSENSPNTATATAAEKRRGVRRKKLPVAAEGAAGREVGAAPIPSLGDGIAEGCQSAVVCGGTVEEKEETSASLAAAAAAAVAGDEERHEPSEWDEAKPSEGTVSTPPAVADTSAPPPPFSSSSLATVTGGDTQAQERPLQPPQPTTRGKKERGNLHCLICFRTDEEEVNPALYENISDDSENDDDDRAARRDRNDSSEDEGMEE